MGGSWCGVVVCVLLVGGATAMSVISEEEGQELRKKIDGEDVKLERETEREDRVFLIFAQVQPNECRTNDTTDTVGTCFNRRDCTSRGGIASGSCAGGLGVCCIITRTCNSETTLNNTYFQEPDAGDSTLGSCTLTVNRLSTNICQIRLDFLQLDLSQPDGNGDCANDFFSVSGGMSQVPKVCGKMTGQHMYYDLDPNGGGVQVIIDRAMLASLAISWSIKVAQIACDSEYRAPVGCLQYFTETYNIVRSFNFDSSTSDNDTKQLANMEYGVCIRRADSYCGVTWTSYSTDGKYAFTMTDHTEVVDSSLIGTSHASSRGDQCTTDYVVIPGGMYYTEETGNVARHSDRYCGLGFPNSVSTSSQPFALYVRTDSNETTDKGNRGFSLSYRQTPCT